MSDSTKDTMPKSELSRPVHVEDLGRKEYTLDIDPSAAELSALGKRLKINSLDALSAHTKLKLLSSGDVQLEARFTARITQTCVVTLKPVSSDVSHAFSTTYSHNVDEGMGHGEEEYDDEEDDVEPSEPIIDGIIDLGDAISEQLALEIDPFPRVKGATFDGFTTGPAGLDEAVPEKKNPFAVLSKLKQSPDSSK
ncbi:MAG: DUF177 domain-containing protein [Magnetovibrio sp.]|nr:DUF177 domain-containing protein [Magnetovibrio sp.]